MKICFWGNISGTLNGKTPGGGELQISLLAKALAKAGNEVIIVDPGGNESFVTAEGIKVITVSGWNNGIWILRTLTHRLPQFYRLLKKQNADIYYCRIRDFRHLLVYRAARQVHGKFILALASDLDILSFWMRCKHNYFTQRFSPWILFSGTFIELVYPFLLNKSDIIFTQHEGQKAILGKKKIKSILNPNLIDLDAIVPVKNPDRKEFIYVGSLAKRKGIIQFYELVQKCPQYQFKVIGQPRDNAGYIYFEKLKSCKNVTLFGRLNHAETIAQIANSLALISTSPMEGFPNIFLESWACGIPVLSLFVNPGDVLEKENLGYFAKGDVDLLISKLSFYSSPQCVGLETNSYLNKTHVLNQKKVEEINFIFNQLIEAD